MRRGWKNENTRRAGFSLLEAVLVTGMMSLVFGAAMSVWLKSQIAFAEQLQQNLVNDTGRRVLARVVNELRAADPTTLTPLIISDSSSVTFTPVVGYNAGVVYGNSTTISLTLETGELSNNLDDNADGRADEGFITIQEQGSPAVQLAGNILGLRFSSIDSGMIVEVDVGIVDRNGDLYQESFSRTVYFRNGS